MRVFIVFTLLLLASRALSSSEAARSKSLLGLGIMQAGISDFVLKNGVSLQTQLGGSHQVGSVFLTGKESVVDFTTSTSSLNVSRAEIDCSAAFLFWRFFVGNSFNIVLGAGQRLAELTYRIEDTSNFYLEGNLKLSGNVGVISLGNHWQWDSGIYFGVDWITVMTPFSSKLTAKTIGTLDESSVSTLNKQFLDLGEELSEINSFTLGLTSIGYMF